VVHEVSNTRNVKKWWMDSKMIKWLENISMKNIAEVGGKTASLGEMYVNMKPLGVEIPYAFAITAKAYNYFLHSNGLLHVVQQLINCEVIEKEELQIKGEKVKRALLAGKIPEDLKKEIIAAYNQLIRGYKKELTVAVRSSATAEILPDASFAGQQESFLNIRNEDELIAKCIECFASLYNERAISYRQDHKITQAELALSICVQIMVRSDLACAGVLFTIDTESGFKNAIIINASWGLGENVVKRVVSSDNYIVFKATLELGFMPILQKKLGGKESKLIYNKNILESVENIPTSDNEKQSFCLSNEEIIQLSFMGLAIEKYYSVLKRQPTPMEIEWAKDGPTGKLYILQARPETVHSKIKEVGTDLFVLQAKSKILLSGDSVGNLFGQGKVRVIHSLDDLKNFQQGEVLVAEKTEPDWEPYMKKAAAIITDRGGRTCHAAIVSRELGIPAIVGTLNGTTQLINGQEVTVACIYGSQCFVYEGILPYRHKILTFNSDIRPATQIMMNIANPFIAFKSSFIPNDGVGLLRMEFIITNSIKIHPMALINFDEIKDQKLKQEINELTVFATDKKDYFVDKLSQCIAMIAAAFYPKEVIVRMSDFKTDVYRGLVGGELYEGIEENPMLGLRGASRYYHPAYRQAFSLECMAVKKVREAMGLTNLKVMIPFCRTIEEGKNVLAEMEKSGLVKGHDGLEVYVMCEIPSNSILAEEFAEIFDGFSIGTNDLTQLTLGIDRNSSVLAPIFSETDAAVLKMIQLAIVGAHKKGKKVGICGQRPSDDNQLVQFLIENKIDSISLNPDAVIRVTEVVKALAEHSPALDLQKK
jgi:pyruvate,water dikinase